MISTTACLWYSFIRKTALFRNINLLSIENFRLMVTIFFFEFANPCSVWLHPCSEMRLDANAIGLHVWDGCSGWGDATCTPDKSRGSYKKFWGYTRYHTVKVVCCGGHTNCPRRPFAWWATDFSTITMQLLLSKTTTTTTIIIIMQFMLLTFSESISPEFWFVRFV